MIHTTPGIVLHSFKYGDSGIIARILTPDFGLQSYLVQGVRKSKSRIRASQFQPLTLLDMVVYTIRRNQDCSA
ncbi:MAG: DNA repair protein RecO [Bacteroidales bacterium]